MYVEKASLRVYIPQLHFIQGYQFFRNINFSKRLLAETRLSLCEHDFSSTRSAYEGNKSACREESWRTFLMVQNHAIVYGYRNTDRFAHGYIDTDNYTHTHTRRYSHRCTQTRTWRVATKQRHDFSIAIWHSIQPSGDTINSAAETPPSNPRKWHSESLFSLRSTWCGKHDAKSMVSTAPLPIFHHLQRRK